MKNVPNLDVPFYGRRVGFYGKRDKVPFFTLFYFEVIPNSGNAIGTAGAIAPPQKEESILVGRTLTMETILCLIKAS